jgi:protein disulfide-isomerase
MLRKAIATLAVAAWVAVASSGFVMAADEKPQPTPAPTAAATAKTGEALVWGTDFAAAKKAAASQKKPILALFTGSDWCIWCVRLEEEIFSQAAFKKYATEQYVLFMADFPQKKKLPAEVKKQNDELAQTYKIEGYPTVLVLDATGKKLAETGYEKGGAEPWIKALDQALVGKIPASPAPTGAK